MSRRPLIVGVWKEKLTLKESVAAAREILKSTAGNDWPFDMGLAPNPFCYAAVADVVLRSHIRLCAQNVLWDAIEGSFIGQTTTKMLNEVGCDYVIVGHSEARGHFFETDAMIADRTKAAVGADICPILCIGENAKEKENGRSRDVLRGQVQAVFAHLGDSLRPASFVVAYEPVWAISTWRSSRPLPTGPEVEQIHLHIRELIAELKNGDFASQVTLVYGGSVAPDNAEDYMAQANVDGALVGGASKTPKSFVGTLQAAKRGFAKRASALGVS